jgi:DNA-binding PadR family transcriptional regulator
MAADGWISAAAGQEGNRPPRHVYRLTQAGEQAFQQLLHENLAGYSPVDFPGDVGMIFLDWLEPGECITLLEQQKRQVQARQEEIRAIPTHAGSLQLIFRHQLRHLQAELEWLDEVMEQLAVK